jgi:hypothetical protein
MNPIRIIRRLACMYWEAQMPINRSVKVSIALVLGGAAVVAAAQSGTQQALGAQLGARLVSAAADNGGNPNAVPPILPRLRPSELAEVRRAEAQQWRALSYRLPAGARYSNVDMAVIAAEGYARS